MKELEDPELAWIRWKKAPEGLHSVARKYKLVRFSPRDVCVYFSCVLTPPRSSQPPWDGQHREGLSTALHCRLGGIPYPIEQEWWKAPEKGCM